MKLRKLFTLFAAFAMALGLAGCSSNKQSSSTQPSQYTTYMNAGIARVKDGDYDEAADKFEQAYDQKKTAQAKAYENQADDFADAQEDIQDYEFKDAKQSLTAVINEDSGYHLMTSRATRLRRKIQTVIDNFQEDINPLRKQAKQELAAGQYSQAADTLQRILDLPYIGGKYYRRVRRQVKNLLAEAQNQAKQHSSANSNIQSNSSSANTKSYSDGSNAGSTDATDTMVGGQAVSMSGRGQIRSRLLALGFDQSQFTDSQIIGIFRTAYANGHQSPAYITAADVHQYLGR